MPDRTNCPKRHENGNCLAFGGFCTAVPDEMCEVINKAHKGYTAGNYFLCSIGKGFGTYGAEKDLLEIMGLLTPEEAACDSVAVFFVPENVFQRISEADKKRKER